jgi:hypothetical protein
LQSFGAHRRNILAIAPGREVRWFFENPLGLKLLSVKNSEAIDWP